jgi:hypothetical protein
VQNSIRDELKKQADSGRGEFSLRLKRQEAWRFEGSVEELFQGWDQVSWQGLWRSACLPVVASL